MSSAIVKVGNHQVLRLGKKLIIGIYLPGTIAHVSMGDEGPGSQFHIRARPYIQYLAKTLHSLQCHVTIIVPPISATSNIVVGRRTTDHFSRFFERHFPLVDYGILYDQRTSTRRGDLRRQNLSNQNYTDYFTTVAGQLGAEVSRVIFIDSEVNYRFSPAQTLVTEAYEPRTHRQKRREIREAAEEAARSGVSVVGHGWRRHESGLRGAAREVQEATDLLLKEQRWVQRKTDGSAGWLGSHSYDPSLNPNRGSAKNTGGGAGGEEGSSAVVDRRMAEQQAAREAVLVKKMRGSNVPLAMEGVAVNYVSTDDPQDEARGAADARDDESGEASSSSAASADADEKQERRHDYRFSEAAAGAALAVQREDFCLVALAEFLTELAASDVSVTDYLKMEPLIEKLRVPFHGITYYLPVENCEYIDEINWDDVRVEEQKAKEKEVVPDVVETKEHEDFFK